MPGVAEGVPPTRGHDGGAAGTSVAAATAAAAAIPALTTLCEQHAEAGTAVQELLASEFEAALGAHAAAEVRRLEQLLREAPSSVQLWPSPALGFASDAADHIHRDFSVRADAAPEGVVHWTDSGAAVVRGAAAAGRGGGTKLARVTVTRFRAPKNPRLLPGVRSDPQVEVSSVDAQQLSAHCSAGSRLAFLLQFKVGAAHGAAAPRTITLRFPSRSARDGVLTAARAASRAGTVDVHVLRARGLPPMDSNGLADPFCVVRCDRTRHDTPVLKKTLAPVWGAEEGGNFRFEGVREGSGVRVDMFDWNLVGADKAMGKVEVAVTAMDGSPRWHPLSPTAGCAQLQGGEPSVAILESVHID
jgi:hypothetical protein